MLASICTTVVTDSVISAKSWLCSTVHTRFWRYLITCAMSVTFFRSHVRHLVGSERVWRRLWDMKTIERQKMLLQDLTDRRKALKLQERELHKRQQQLIKMGKGYTQRWIDLIHSGKCVPSNFDWLFGKKTGWAAAHISGNHGAQHWGTLSGS